MPSPLFATCLTTQHARKLWVELVLGGVECMEHGLSSSTSRTDLVLIYVLFLFYVGPEVIGPVNGGVRLL